ncbi:unnamed protein product [Didymodactylos carnosus]|uniref:Uncharacterized protein n=1 Tax=Didymodactylos carnosus TaxID=1234261 RepID=A0A815U9F2_9BILA|nr:unnamed protein product [Didymodactylos carnosus]CAF4375693.1 unnamed protein product [Didymodactylos carnosus]
MDNDRLHAYYRAQSLGAMMLKTTEQLLNTDNHDLQLNIENTTTRMNRDNNDLRIIAGSIKTNPFLSNDGDQLYRLSTGVVIPDDVVKELLTCGSVGAVQATEFITKRLLNKVVKYDDKIVSNNVRTLSSYQEISRPMAKPKTDKQKKKIQMFLSNISMIKTHRQLDLVDIFKHEIIESPPALSFESGTLYHPQERNSIVSYFENLFPKHVVRDKFSLKCPIHLLINGSDLLVNVSPTKAATYEEYAIETMAAITESFDIMERIDIVFNSDITTELKDYIQQTSSSKNVIKAVIQPHHKIVDAKKIKKWQEFIDSNEDAIAACLKQVSQRLNYMVPSGKKLIISGPDNNSVFITDSGYKNCDELNSNQPLLCTRLLFNASQKMNDNYSMTIIKSTNTDVVILGIALMNSIGTEVWINVTSDTRNKENKSQNLNVSEINKEFFIKYLISSEILLPLHALSGSEITSHIRGITKKTIFDTFLNHVDKFEKILEISTFPLSGDSLRAAESLLLCAAKNSQSNLDHARAVAAANYMKKGDVSELLQKLLPTSNAWLQHCRRANLISTIWRQALNRLSILPPFENNGFSLQDNILYIQWTSISTWPDQINGLRICTCEKGDCSRCFCSKQNVYCIPEVCACDLQVCTRRKQ